jgi:aminoglycoside 6'-N-acetyltransferase I
VIPPRLQLFPDGPPEEQRLELGFHLRPMGLPGTVGNMVCLIAERDGALLGFVEVMLRSHAEGCWEHTVGRMGVAYLEAWFVAPKARRQGVGRALVAAAEDWARAQGSAVLASDAEPENLRSQTSHKALGFREVGRTVNFVKTLGDRGGRRAATAASESLGEDAGARVR